MDKLITLLITAAMVALIRLIDAAIAVEAGLPISSLRPRTVEDLNAEAKAYVEGIVADRAAAAGMSPTV